MTWGKTSGACSGRNAEPFGISIRTAWLRPTPVMGLAYMVNELLGGTDDESRYVYLSDGGHFENLGIYELVKRRCGLIIVCDAEADGKYGLTGLGNAIRKCRIDLGINIDLDVSNITPEEAGKPSKQYCAVGDIHYETTDLSAPMGKIIYFKSSLTGHEPADVKNYSKMHAAFPHESTIDQWFSESQFESYRQLGHYVVVSSIKGLPPVIPQAAAPAQSSVCSHKSGAVTPRYEVNKNADSEGLPLKELIQKTLNTFGFDTSGLAPWTHRFAQLLHLITSCEQLGSKAAGTLGATILLYPPIDASRVRSPLHPT